MAKRQVKEEDVKAPVDKAIARAVKRSGARTVRRDDGCAGHFRACIEKRRVHREIYGAVWPQAVEQGDIRLHPEDVGRRARGAA